MLPRYGQHQPTSQARTSGAHANLHARPPGVSSLWHDDLMTLSVDFSATPEGRHGAEIQRLCDAMEAADRAGRYPRLTVERPWSVHNPVLDGEFASPRAIRW